jgi:hypothetical protein
MLTIQAGRAQDTSNSNYKKSAAEYARFTPPSGLRLTVGMVADSVRGGPLGPEAAIAGAMKILSESLETDIPTLLYAAFDTAHRVVRRVGQENGLQLATTLTVALIVNNERLYVANLGHSRVYLYRARTGTLDQLTIEHNFASVAVLEERLTPKDAILHPDADVLSRYIGTPKLINPDMTIYADSEVANLGEGIARGAIGLELYEHDAVLVATESLTQTGRQGTAVIAIEDILDAFSREGARQAALDIMENAIRRHPTEPISLVVLQTIAEDSARNRLTRGALVGIVSTLALFTLLILLALFNVSNSQLPPPPPTRNFATQTEQALSIIQSFTPTATSTSTLTPTATLPPDASRLGLNFLNEPDATDEGISIEEHEVVSTGSEHRVLTINDFFSQVEQEAFIFAQPGTDLRLTRARNEQAYFILDRGGDIFVAPRDYDLIEVELSQIPGIVFSGDENSCFAVYYSTSATGREVTISCYAGLCTYRLPHTTGTSGTETPTATPLPPIIAIGQQVKIDLDRVVALDPLLPIPLSEAERYAGIYQRRSNLSIGDCITNFLPTPTPTGSPTAIILPTDTPTGTLQPTRRPAVTPNAAALPAVPTQTPRPTTDPYP